jgi:ketosteroid isomerase-like protein
MEQASGIGEDPVLALAERFFKAIESCDLAALRLLYADDAVVWHNYDPLEARADGRGGAVVAQNIALLGAVPKLIAGLRYEVWHRERTHSGFVQQHLVTGRSPDGEPVRFPVCIVCRVENGCISALYEYLDVGHLPASVLRHFAELATQGGQTAAS